MKSHFSICNLIRFILCIVLLASSIVTVSARERRGAALIVDMKCEYATEPLAIDQSKIRFTWAYAAGANQRGFEQLTAEVRIAQSEQALRSEYDCVAMSGRVNTPYSRIDMLTSALKPHSRYCWQVRLYNGIGMEIMRSDVA